MPRNVNLRTRQRCGLISFFYSDQYHKYLRPFLCDLHLQFCYVCNFDSRIRLYCLLSFAFRECLLFGRSRHASCFSSSSFYIVQAPILICANESRGLNENFLKCYCWGMLVGPENAPPSNLVSAMDEVLLMVSVILAYMAGAVPQRKNLDFMSHYKNENLGSSSTHYGR